MFLNVLNTFLPEGCTPADARVLRKANHEFAQINYELNEKVEKLETLLKEASEIIEHDNEILRQTHTIKDDWWLDTEAKELYEESKLFIKGLRST